MFKKRYALLALLSLLICIVAISSVSAADDALNEDLTTNEAPVELEAVSDDSVGDDALKSENDNEIVNDAKVEESPDETIAVSEDQEDIPQETLTDDESNVDTSKNVLASSENEQMVSQVNNEEVIGRSPYYNEYNATVNDLSVQVGNTISIPIHIDPANMSSGDIDYKYDFYFRLYDSSGSELIDKNLYSSSLSGSYIYYNPADNYYSDLAVGTYTIKLVNYKDDHLMDTATLRILPHSIQNVTVTITQSGAYYNQKYVTVKVIDKVTHAVCKYYKVELRFSNGKKANVTTNANGIAKYKVPLNAGYYKLTAVVLTQYVKGQSSKVNVNILKHGVKITMSQVGKYYKDKKLRVKLYDTVAKSVIKGKWVKVTFSNGKVYTAKTNSKGIATLNINFKPGKYRANAYFSVTNYKYTTKKLSNVRIYKVPIKLIVRKYRANYDSAKYLTIKAINKVTKKPVKGVKLKIKVSGGKMITRTTACNGKASFDASIYKVGKHKVTIKIASKKFHTGKSAKTSAVIKKGKVSIYAPETVNCLKQSDNYTVWVYNNESWRPVKGAKVTIKVYTGKKVKTYTRKTDQYGIARFNTKSLSKGKHKVVVSTKANKYYRSAKAQGSVEMSKKIPTDIGYYYPLHYRAYSTTYYIGWYGYTTTHVYAVGVEVYLKDKKGNSLYKDVSVTHSNGEVAYGKSGETIYVSGSNSGTITLSFAGDNRYLGSSYTFSLS